MDKAGRLHSRPALPTKLPWRFARLPELCLFSVRT